MTKEISQNIQNNKEFTLFPWAVQGGLNPIDAVDADGVYVYERGGKRHIDFSSQLMNVNVGHKNKKINDAIKKQVDKFSYVYPSIATESRGTLGKMLKEIAPDNMQKTFFTSGGADSVENAMIMARLVTGRSKIITRYRSYHGATYGAFTAGGDPRKHSIDRDQMSNVIHVEDPYCYRCPWSQKIESCKRECVSHVERIIQFEGPQNIAAILMEGESGTSGCIKYPPDYWQKIDVIAKKYGILIIVDEVMSGFGRCGDWFAINKTGIKPDMITMAKGINSGYVPLGGIMVSKEIAEFFENNMLPTGLTYSGHALACAAGVANIEVMRDENLIERTKEMGQYLIEQVEILKEKHRSIGDFRSSGLLGCLELVKNRESKEPLIPWNAKPEESEIIKKIISKFRELGLITFARWNHIFIAPPLIISKEEMDEGLRIISQALEIADEYCE
jgi:taurine---2-oxoglutarate transaminase